MRERETEREGEGDREREREREVPPEGLEIVPYILTQLFLEIRILTATGAG